LFAFFVNFFRLPASEGPTVLRRAICLDFSNIRFDFGHHISDRLNFVGHRRFGCLYRRVYRLLRVSDFGAKTPGDLSQESFVKRPCSVSLEDWRMGGAQTKNGAYPVYYIAGVTDVVTSEDIELAKTPVPRGCVAKNLIRRELRQVTWFG